MARYGLIRPVEGRYFAGVCAAVGRATNTDPVLWRVLFAVLTLFGGVGLLAYLIGWLLIPADGDTASPVEAVLGRGVSRTSAPVAVIGAVVAILVFALVASEGLRPAVVGALVVLGAAVLLSRGTLQRPGQNQAGGAAFPPPPMVPPSPHQPASGMFGPPGTPGMAGAPGMTGMPGTHVMPGMYGVPGHGGMPGMHGVPGHGGMPGRPPTSGAPGMPGRPATPGAPGMPWTSGAPAAPGTPTAPGTPVASGSPSTPVPPVSSDEATTAAGATAGPSLDKPTVPAAGVPTVHVPVTPSDPSASEPTVQKPPLAEPDLPAETDPGAEVSPEASAESATHVDPDAESATRLDPDRRDEVVPAHAHAVPDETPTLPQPPDPPFLSDPTWGQPFAPHGPFAPPGPYPPTFGPVPQSQTRRLPLYGPYPPVPGAGLPWDSPVSADPMSHYPGMPFSGAPMQQPKPKVKRPKSRLGRVTIYATAVALGTLATVHLLGASIAGSAYFAVALAVIGLGLVAGAWVGRARLLIPLGFALSLGLLISTASTVDGPYRGGPPELLNPTTVTEINANSPYQRDTGDHTLDFSRVDFTGQQVSFEASIDVGKIRVVLPPNVDVVVKAKVEVGDARVLNSSWGGLSDRWRTVVDHGADGPKSGGDLQLTLSVDVGNLEVVR